MRLPTACPKPERKEKPRPTGRQHNSTLPARTSSPRRSGRIVAKPRPKQETERIYGPKERREWTKRQPCIVPGCGRAPCDAAHLISGGTGRKSDAKWTVPFCSSNPMTGYVGHHDQYDDGKRSFMAKHFPGLGRAELAVAVEQSWQDHLSNQKGTMKHETLTAVDTNE